MSREERKENLAAVAGSALLGIAFLVGAAMGAMAKDPPPAVLTICIGLGGIMQLGVAQGLRRGARGAWALGVALDGVLAIVALFGLPALFRAGVPHAAAIAAVVGLAVMFGVLVGARKD